MQPASPTEPAPAVADRRLLVTADVERLAEVRAFVREAVATFGGSKRVADDLVQAVDEATSGSSSPTSPARAFRLHSSWPSSGR